MADTFTTVPPSTTTTTTTTRGPWSGDSPLQPARSALRSRAAAPAPAAGRRRVSVVTPSALADATVVDSGGDDVDSDGGGGTDDRSAAAAGFGMPRFGSAASMDAAASDAGGDSNDGVDPAALSGNMSSFGKMPVTAASFRAVRHDETTRRRQRRRTSSVGSAGGGGGGTGTGADEFFASVAALMEKARDQSSNDFLSAWNREAATASHAPAAALAMLPGAAFEAVHRAWKDGSVSRHQRSFHRRGLARPDRQIGMRQFVALLAPMLVLADLYGRDGLASGAHAATGAGGPTKAQMRRMSTMFRSIASGGGGTDDPGTGGLAREESGVPVVNSDDDGGSGNDCDNDDDGSSIKQRQLRQRMQRQRQMSVAAAAASGSGEALLLGMDAATEDEVGRCTDAIAAFDLQGGAVPLNSPLMDFLCDVFEMIDHRRRGLVTWEAFVTFVIERVYGHDLSSSGDGQHQQQPSSAASGGTKRITSTEEEEASLRVNPVTGTRATLQYVGQVEMAEPEGQQWIGRLHHFPSWGATVSVSRSTAAAYLTEDLDEYLLDADAASAGEVVRRQKAGGKSLQKRRQIARRVAQRATEGPWKKNQHDIAAEEACKATYMHAPASIHCCEYLAGLGTFATVSNSLSDQLGLYSVHLRKDITYTRRIRANVEGGSHISVIKEVPSYFSGQRSAPHASALDASSVLDRTSDAAAAAAPQFHAPADKAALMLGLRSGVVQYFELTADATRKASRTQQLKPLHHFALHDDDVTDAIFIPRTGRMLTSSLDATVCVHVPGTDKVTSRFRGHEKGVTTLAYSAAFEVFLSGGFEYHAYSWAENLPNSPAFKLIDTNNPHTQPLSGIVAVDGTPQVYTADVSGVVKLFDVRSLKVIDTWRAFDPGRVPVEVAQDVKSSGSRDTFHLGDVGSMCYTGPRHRSLLFGATNTYVFHTEVRSADAQRTHDMAEPLLGIHVGRRLIVTATAASARAWSIRTGSELATHPLNRVTSSPVTVLTYDDSSARVYTGHQDGSIFAFHAESGVLCRRYLRHEARVRAIAIDAVSMTLISSSSRGDVLFWDLQDRHTAATDPLGHLKNLAGSLTPMPNRSARRLELPPENLRPWLLPGTPLEARKRVLARWASHRWRMFVAQRRGGNPRLAPRDTGRASNTLTVSRPRGAIHLRHPAVKIVVDARRMRCVVMSAVSNCRVVDYARPKPTTVHRMFHGKDTDLASCAFWPDRNIVCVGDASGGIFAWLCAAGLDAPLLLGKWQNKCQLSSYSHPLSDFLRDDDVDTADAVADGEAIEFELETNEDDEKAMLEAAAFRRARGLSLGGGGGPDDDEENPTATAAPQLPFGDFSHRRRSTVAGKLPSPNSTKASSRRSGRGGTGRKASRVSPSRSPSAAGLQSMAGGGGGGNRSSASSSPAVGLRRTRRSSSVSSNSSAGSSLNSSRRSSLASNSGVSPFGRGFRSATERAQDDAVDRKLSQLVPAVTEMHLDAVRGYLITGDDVGYISLWEIDPLYSGQRSSQAAALIEGETTGAAARFVHSWRGHQHPVIHLSVMPHTAYAIVSAATDNVAAFWWPDGTWAAGLRQGPVVDRQFKLPSSSRSRRAWAVLAFRKILNASKDGRLKEAVSRPRDEPPPSIYGPRLRAALKAVTGKSSLVAKVNDVRAQVVVVSSMSTSVFEATQRREQSKPTLAQLAGRPRMDSRGAPRPRNRSTNPPFERRVDAKQGGIPLMAIETGDAEEGPTLVGGTIDGDDRLHPSFEAVEVAAEQFEDLRRTQRATSGVTAALRRAHDATGVPNPDDMVDHGTVVADPLRHAQKDLDKYKREQEEARNRQKAAQESVQNIAKAQSEMAAKHLRSQTALSGLPSKLAKRVRLCCGTVCLGGAAEAVPEATVRFPALVMPSRDEAESEQRALRERQRRRDVASAGLKAPSAVLSFLDTTPTPASRGAATPSTSNASPRRRDHHDNGGPSLRTSSPPPPVSPPMSRPPPLAAGSGIDLGSRPPTASDNPQHQQPRTGGGGGGGYGREGDATTPSRRQAVDPRRRGAGTPSVNSKPSAAKLAGLFRGSTPTPDVGSLHGRNRPSSRK